jgi:hypothetical protein
MMTLHILELIITTGSMKILNIRNVFMLMLYKYDIQHVETQNKDSITTLNIFYLIPW